MTNPFEKRHLFDATPVRREVLSAQAFLDLKAKEPGAITTSRPAIPPLGKPGFGGIEVTYATPKFKVSV